MLAQETDVDAVTVTTPDHTHAVITLAAMRAGKHVYTQKPLVRTLAESRAVRAAAGNMTSLVTQMGNQGHAAEGVRKLREWIEAGLIGTVREVHFWTNRPIWPVAGPCS
jgi:predicted dehydrogenase